jgi:hypothetical protein
MVSLWVMGRGCLEKGRAFAIIFRILLLGDRPTVGHMALDHGIGVRIPVSQPILGASRRLGF